MIGEGAVPLALLELVTFALSDTTPENKSIPCNVTEETADLPGITGAMDVEVILRSWGAPEGRQAVSGLSSQLFAVGFQKANPCTSISVENALL